MKRTGKTQQGRRGLRAAALSDVGRVRKNNEDAFALLPDRGLMIVSDGMGGHHAGAAASRIVVSILPNMLEETLSSIPALRTKATRATKAAKGAKALSLALRDTIVNLSRQVWEQSTGQPGLAGMGATVVMVCVRRDQAYIASMGDSRAYLYRNRKLKQLTEDHSIVGILLRNREITREEAKVHPARNQLSRYLGMEGAVYPDVRSLRLSPGDRLLLCTDGLTGMVEDKVIARLLAGCREPEAACRALVDAANSGGGKDNITALVADWHGVED